MTVDAVTGDVGVVLISTLASRLTSMFTPPSSANRISLGVHERDDAAGRLAGDDRHAQDRAALRRQFGNTGTPFVVSAVDSANAFASDMMITHAGDRLIRREQQRDRLLEVRARVVADVPAVRSRSRRS
jgi:hypothetical protein